MKHPALHLTAVLLVLTLASLPAQAIAPAYTVTDLGDLAGYGSYAYGVNDSGWVVGRSYTGDGSTYHAFLWRPGSGMIDLGTLGGATSRAQGINNTGQVTGTARNLTTNRAFIRQAGGGMTDLGTLGGTSSVGWGINNLGQVVGVASTTSGAYHAFLWTAGSGMADLGFGGTPYGVNDLAQVTGVNNQTSFFWEAATGVTWLGSLGGVWTQAFGINNSGQVVGYSDTVYDPEGNGYPHAFLWTQNVGMRDLGTLGGVSSMALGINNHGEVVGYDSSRGAIIWTEEAGMLDLDTLIAPGTGWHLSAATAISDVGYIVGDGFNSVGQHHAFLLTPVPEPAGLSVLAASAVATLFLRRRRCLGSQ